MSNHHSNLNSPWFGPVPCTEEDVFRFFGRKKDISNLRDKIRIQKLTILSAKSGAGKTSLINAGLVPALRLTRERDPNKTGFVLNVSSWSVISKNNSPEKNVASTEENEKKKTKKSDVLNPAYILIAAIATTIEQLLKKTENKPDNLLGVDQLCDDLKQIKSFVKEQNKQNFGDDSSKQDPYKKLTTFVDELRKKLLGRVLIIIIDQAEEFMGSGNQDLHDNFYLTVLRVFSTLLQIDGVRLVISLRDEYLMKLRSIDGVFAPLGGQRLYILEPLTWAGARDVLSDTALSDGRIILPEYNVDYLFEQFLNVETEPDKAKQRDLLPVDMLSIQALLFTMWERNSSKYKSNPEIDKQHIDYFRKKLESEEKSLLEKQEVKLIEVPLLHWLDSAFAKVVVPARFLIQRIFAAMGPVLMSPRGFKSHTTDEDLILYAAGKILSMTHVTRNNIKYIKKITRNDFEEIKRITDANTAARTTKFSELLTLDKFEEIRKKMPEWKDCKSDNEIFKQRGQIEVILASYITIELLLEANVLKDYGTTHGGSVLSLRHDGYGAILPEWCEDIDRRENDYITPRIGIFGAEIRRKTKLILKTINEQELERISWEGSFVDKIKVKGITFNDCGFVGSFFDCCDFSDCSFIKCKFDGAVFKGGIFTNVTFTKCRNAGIVMEDMTWKNDVNFDDCEISSAVVKNITLDGQLQLTKCKAWYAQLYKFEKRENAKIAADKACDFYGALFVDYQEEFKCDNVNLKEITNAPEEERSHQKENKGV